MQMKKKCLFKVEASYMVFGRHYYFFILLSATEKFAAINTINKCFTYFPCDSKCSMFISILLCCSIGSDLFLGNVKPDAAHNYSRHSLQRTAATVFV